MEANLGDSLALMSIESGKYLGMNEVGKHIWSALREEITFDQLILSLTREFNVDAEVCKADCIRFLENLNENNMIVLK